MIIYLIISLLLGSYIFLHFIPISENTVVNLLVHVSLSMGVFPKHRFLEMELLGYKGMSMININRHHQIVSPKEHIHFYLPTV